MLLLMIPLAVGFVWLHNYLDNRPINWVTYSTAELDRNLDKGRTVLVNFRAAWTISCVTHEPLALETPNVRRWIRFHDLIAMRADYTNGSPEIKAALQSIGQDAIPVVAVYPAASPDDPIVLSGMITEEMVLDALKQAERKR